jgi:hypothetical protein
VIKEAMVEDSLFFGPWKVERSPWTIVTVKPSNRQAVELTSSGISVELATVYFVARNDNGIGKNDHHDPLMVRYETTRRTTYTTKKKKQENKSCGIST